MRRHAYAVLPVFASAFLVLVSLMPPIAHADCSYCNEILHRDIRNKLSIKRGQDIHSSLRTAVCNQQESGQASSSGGGAGISLPLGDILLGVKGDYESQQLRTLKQQHCGADSSSFSDADYTSVELAVVDKEIPAQWTQCMSKCNDSDAGGMKGKVSREESSTPVFAIRFAAGLGATEATVMAAPTVMGGKCELPIGKDAKIQSNWIEVPCTRADAKEDVVFVVNTDKGGIVLVAPAHVSPPPPPPPPVTPPPPPPKSNHDKCRDGDAEGCSAFAKEIDCGGPMSPVAVLMRCQSRQQCITDRAIALEQVSEMCPDNPRCSVARQQVRSLESCELK